MKYMLVFVVSALSREHLREKSGRTFNLRGQDSGVKLSFILLLLLLIPSSAMAQRYGRPYTLAEIPETPRRLLLEVTVGHKNGYVHDSELRKMRRSTVIVTDPTTKQKHAYEGVALDELVAQDFYSGKIVEIEYGSHHVQTLSETAPDGLAELIVADTVDGKSLSPDAPYSLVETSQDKSDLIVAGVYRISVKSEAKAVATEAKN